MSIGSALANAAATSLTPASMPAEATTAAAATAAGGAAAVSSNALTSLTSNFQDFLSMLMTQLQNQDPTSPMDTNQFTEELVEFSSVEQQINTNSSLTQLIQLTQSGQVEQSASIVGHQVELNSGDLALQSGTGAISFTAPSAGPVEIGVYDANGNKVADTVVSAAQGSNNWTWNGQDGNGVQLPDGGYQVSVDAPGASGQPTALPFTVLATATGVQQTASGLQLELGSTSVPFSALQSVLN
jgi:flagellar basal-body rod modification protein FlgD